MPFFTILSTLSIDWASPVKPGHATDKKAWRLVTTYIGDILDKLTNTFRNASQNRPPAPWMVGGATTPAALTTTPTALASAPIVSPTPRVESTATVFQFFAIDPNVQRPQQRFTDPQSGGSYSWHSWSRAHRDNSSTPQPRRGASGDKSDIEDDTSQLSDEPNSYEWRFPANKTVSRSSNIMIFRDTSASHWVNSLRNSFLKSLGARLFELFMALRATLVVVQATLWILESALPDQSWD